MSYTRKRYKNGRPRFIGEPNGQATVTTNSTPKRYSGRTGSTPPPADNYLRKIKVTTTSKS